MTRIASDLGAYILPGKVSSPVAGITQAEAGERIGLGTVWLSERWESKELGVTLGAVTHATSRVNLGVATTHFVTRHPLVLAGMASTLQLLGGNRLILGFARSAAWRWKQMGVPVQTSALMEDYVSILRRLWAGEKVSYDGPAGVFPQMQMADLPEKAPPLMLAAQGPKTLALAGRLFDGALLHPFLTVEGVRRSVEVVREAAVKAGRKPEDVKVFGGVAVAPGGDVDVPAYAVHGRAVSYLIHRMISEWLVMYNEWDPAPVEALEKLNLERLEVAQLSVEEVQARLIEASALVPKQWLREGAALGSPAEIAERLKAYRKAGADEIIIHGTTPERLGDVVTAYLGA